VNNALKVPLVDRSNDRLKRAKKYWQPVFERPSPGYPAHPIAPGGRPPGIWGGNDPFPGYGLPPGYGIWPSPGYPAHPLPGPPPGYWGGSSEPFPGYGLPGGGPPSVWGGTPAHPIVIPPPPPEAPSAPEGEKPPREGGGWGYSSDYGWGYFPAGGSPSPKK
jgi:hypothetical protein